MLSDSNVGARPGFPVIKRTVYSLVMGSKRVLHDSRRSTRVPLKVVISVLSDGDGLVCEGETIVVNLHGALLSTKIPLTVGMKISIHVYLTDKRANAGVVYIDPEEPLHCGIALDLPKNIWGVPLPPEDWESSAALDTGQLRRSS